MGVPDLATARHILASIGLPHGVVVHSEGVRRVAVAAGGLVAEAGIPVDGSLVEACALLHDLDKVRLAAEGGEHGILGACMLTELGYAELAVPVASHPVSCLLDEERFPIGWPSVLVAVADRFVAQEFMPIDERLNDMQRRHPEHAARIEAARRPAHALAAQVAEAVGLDARGLEARLSAAWQGGA